MQPARPISELDPDLVTIVKALARAAVRRDLRAHAESMARSRADSEDRDLRPL